jgi:hypothetical protein
VARLKRVAARQTLTLTHYGRRSGKPYEVTIWFVADRDKVYIGIANVNRQWVRNVQKRRESDCPLAARRSTARHAFSPTAPSMAQVLVKAAKSTIHINAAAPPRGRRAFGHIA